MLLLNVVLIFCLTVVKLYYYLVVKLYSCTVVIAWLYSCPVVQLFCYFCCSFKSSTIIPLTRCLYPAVMFDLLVNLTKYPQGSRSQETSAQQIAITLTAQQAGPRVSNLQPFYSNCGFKQIFGPNRGYWKVNKLVWRTMVQK